MAQKETAEITEKTVKLMMPVPLTEAEKANLGDRVTGLEVEVAGLEAEKKRIAKEFKNKIDPLEKEILELSEMFQSGAEERETDCLLRFDYTHGEVITIRRDTEQVVEKRTMSAEELQRDMGLAGDAEKNGGAPVGAAPADDDGDPEFPEAPEAPPVPEAPTE